MVYSRSKNFLYIHIYKTAGTSLRQELDRYASSPYSYTTLRGRCRQSLERLGLRLPGTAGKVIGKHLKLTEALELLPPSSPEKLWSFTFVRNSWDWLVSIYHYILQDKHHPRHGFVHQLGSFDSFLNWYLESEDLELQSAFVCLPDGSVGVDFVGRFDRLQNDYDMISQQLGLRARRLMHRNSSTRRTDYRTYYTDARAEQIAVVFREDIERFGFNFDPQQ